MDCLKYLTVLVVLFVKDGDSGGHGGGHHDHLRLHLPEFIHHSHHTKVITIHHHHHKPKKEHHHHHHHHHPKPIIPYGHHYHKHHAKSHVKIKTITKGNHQKDFGGHHNHHAHKEHHGHHHHSNDDHNEYHGPHGYPGFHNNHAYGVQQSGPVQHDPTPQYQPPSPSYSYEPHSSDGYEHFNSFSPIAPAYPGNSVQQIPKVHGISHTVKQVNVFDSLPGSIPVVPGKSVATQGYEVTEAGGEDEDSFYVVNNLEQSYPATVGFVRGAAPISQDAFSGPTPQVTGVFGVQTHDPFAASPLPTADFGNNIDDIEFFTGTDQTAPFSSSAPDFNENISSVQPSVQSLDHVTFKTGDSDVPATSFIGATGQSFLSENNHDNDDTPVTFSRAAGIQQSVKTGNVETLVY